MSSTALAGVAAEGNDAVRMAPFGNYFDPESLANFICSKEGICSSSSEGNSGKIRTTTIPPNTSVLITYHLKWAALNSQWPAGCSGPTSCEMSVTGVVSGDAMGSCKAGAKGVPRPLSGAQARMQQQGGEAQQQGASPSEQAATPRSKSGSQAQTPPPSSEAQQQGAPSSKQAATPQSKSGSQAQTQPPSNEGQRQGAPLSKQAATPQSKPGSQAQTPPPSSEAQQQGAPSSKQAATPQSNPGSQAQKPPPSSEAQQQAAPSSKQAATPQSKSGRQAQTQQRSGEGQKRSESPPQEATKAQPPAPQGAIKNTYAIRPGDTLSSIAGKLYHDANRWPEILRQNPRINPRHLPIGQEINIEVNVPGGSGRSANTPTAQSGPGAQAQSQKPSGEAQNIGKQSSNEKQPSAPSTAPSAPQTQSYTISAGDTLSRISEKFYHDPNRWEEIAKANPKLDPRRLRIGEVINIPSPTSNQTSG